MLLISTILKNPSSLREITENRALINHFYSTQKVGRYKIYLMPQPNAYLLELCLFAQALESSGLHASFLLVSATSKCFSGRYKIVQKCL